VLLAETSPGVLTLSEHPIVHRAGTPLAGVTGTSASHRRDIDICRNASVWGLGIFVFIYAMHLYCLFI
jgi:hypothetical protein